MPMPHRLRVLRPGRAARAAHIALVWLLVVGSLATVAGAGALTLLGARFDAQRTVLTDAFPDSALRAPVTVGPIYAAQNILLIGAAPADPAAADPADADPPDADPVGADPAASDPVVTPERFTGMMLVHAPANRAALQVMSILSDTEVTLPGQGPESFTDLLAGGGVARVVQGVEGLLGVRMNHVAVVDLAAVSEITDLVGGIGLFNTVGMMSTGADRHYFALDTLNLDGPRALEYVAGDFAVVDSDYRRARSQQTYTSAVLSHVRKNLLHNPLLLPRLLDLVADNLAADSGLTASYITALAAQLLRVRGGDTVFFFLPTGMVPAVGDAPPVRVPHPDKMDSVRSAFQTDAFDPDYWNPTPVQSRIND